MKRHFSLVGNKPIAVKQADQAEQILQECGRSPGDAGRQLVEEFQVDSLLWYTHKTCWTGLVLMWALQGANEGLQMPIVYSFYILPYLCLHHPVFHSILHIHLLACSFCPDN